MSGRRTATFLGLVSTLALVSAAAAQKPKGRSDKELKVGDPAPGLSVESWIEGGEVKITEGTVYLLLFFESATESGQTSVDPLSALKNLGSLYERHLGKSLRVLVITPDSAEKLGDSLQEFKQEGFSIAADRRNATWRAWVDKAGLSEFPAAFVVNRQSRIAWIGSPKDESFPKILAKVIDGRHDPQLQKQADPILEQARRARTIKNWRLAQQLYDQVIKLGPRVFADVAIEKFEMYIATDHMADREAGYKYAHELISVSFADDGPALRILAAKIAVDHRIADADRDLDVALEAAEAALKASGENDPASLAAMALIRFHRGELQSAVDYQTRAYMIALPAEKPAFKRDLKKYQEAARASG